MSDRYHGSYAPNRSSTFNNPARSSMPSSVGYGSLYAGDMHVMPSSARHPVTTPRGHTTTTSNGGSTTTRTYAVTQDPQMRSSVAPRESSQARRSTLDSSSRPPVIVTTRQAGQQQASHSPIRHVPRASDGHLHAQPASSIRSRSQAPTNHRTRESEDYSRGRERDRTEAALAARDAEAYRSSRPSVVYQSDPRHTTPAVDYNAGDFSYTNAGELARYDLDHSGPPRHRRRESLDRGYHRPNVSYNADSRSFNVNTSADLSRNYTMNTSRPYDSHSRGGPPPSTRGFDKLDRSFDSARDVPPQAPVPPPPSTLRPRETEPKRERPVSLYQDAVPRSSHHDDYYRSREDERNARELRDRERESERSHETPSFQDESVISRGFGIRTGPTDDYDDRRDRKRESWREEPRKRSDEDFAREADLDRERRRRSHLDDKVEPRRRSDEDLLSDRDRDRRRRSRLEEREEPPKRSAESISKDHEPEYRRTSKDEPRDKRDSRRDDGEDRTRLRDKIASGVGVAAAAVGLTGAASSSKDRDRDESHDREPRRRRSPTESRDKKDGEKDRYAERPKDRDHDRERKESRDRDYDRERKDSREDPELKERHRRDAEARLGGEAPASGSDSEKTSRRQPAAIAFNPNDASDITKLREQLSERRDDRPEREPVERSTPREPQPERSSAREVDEPRAEPKAESRSAGGFNPNDAGDISKLREQLAATDTSGKGKGGEKEYSKRDPAIVETGASRSVSPPEQPRRSESHERQRSREPRGREVALVGSDERTVRVVSPPRDKSDDKPIKGILKQPSNRFPEERNFVREGAAPHKDDKRAKDVPSGAKWTKISRKIVNPEALTVGKERFELRDDFVIVLRVLNKEEIQAYAAATQVLRERRRGKRDDEEPAQDDKEDDTRDDEEARRRRRRRHRDEDHDTEDRDHDRERRRRHRREDDDYEVDASKGHRRERATAEM